MQLRFLIYIFALDTHFASLAPLFERVVRKATHEEFEVEDIYRLAQQSHVEHCISGACHQRITRPRPNYR